MKLNYELFLFLQLDIYIKLALTFLRCNDEKSRKDELTTTIEKRPSNNPNVNESSEERSLMSEELKLIDVD